METETSMSAKLDEASQREVQGGKTKKKKAKNPINERHRAHGPDLHNHPPPSGLNPAEDTIRRLILDIEALKRQLKEEEAKYERCWQKLWLNLDQKTQRAENVSILEQDMETETSMSAKLDEASQREVQGGKAK